MKSLPQRLLTADRISLLVKVGSIFAAVLMVYHQDFTILANAATTSELTSHVLLIPFMLAYVTYRRRKILRTVTPLENASTERTKLITEIVGVLLCFLAFVLYWQASHTFYPLEYHLVSLPIFVSGCILILFNPETLKALAFPIALLLFLIPPPVETVQKLGAQLSFLSSQAAFWVLKALSLPVELSTEYGNPVIILEKTPVPITFNVDIACSGVYSLIAFTLVAFFITYLVKGSISKKASMFFIGLPMVYTLNILRIIIIVLIGFLIGEEMSMTVFHVFSGWILASIGTLVLLRLSEKILKIPIFTARSNPTKCASCKRSLQNGENFCFSCGKILKHVKTRLSRRDACKIAALLLGLSVIIPFNVPIFTLTKEQPQIITQSPEGEQVSTDILPEIDNYTLVFGRRVTGYEKRTHQDAALVYYYIPKQNSSRLVEVTVEIGPTYDSVHSWELCLLFYPQAQGWQPTVTVLDQRNVQLLQNPIIWARFFAFHYIGEDVYQVVLYWFEQGVFDTGFGAKHEYMLVGLMTYFDHPDECAEVEEMLLPFAKTAVDYWGFLSEWPWIFTVIATEGRRIIPAIAVLLVAILVFQLYRIREQRESNLDAYNRLKLKEEKLVLLAVHQACEKGKPTGKDIVLAYQKLAGKPMEPDVLHEKLTLAEEAGFVKREVASVEDEPVVTWKSLIGFPGEQLFMSLRLL
jgi:exosortase